MSDAHNESVIKTPKQLAAAVIGFFLITVIGIILLVQYVTADKLTGAGSNSQAPEEIATRIAPVADTGFTFKDVNAPKVGDAASWSARIAEGYDTLVKHAIGGLRAMPAKGGNPDLDDVEVARAVVFMANRSGAKFKEPEVPSAPAAPAAPAAPGAAAAAAEKPAEPAK